MTNCCPVKVSPSGRALHTFFHYYVLRREPDVCGLLLFSDGLCLFRAFLVSEFSEENIAFYLACEDYKETKHSKLALKAKKIYNEFVCADAPREVKNNLTHTDKSVS